MRLVNVRRKTNENRSWQHSTNGDLAVLQNGEVISLIMGALISGRLGIPESSDQFLERMWDQKEIQILLEAIDRALPTYLETLPGDEEDELRSRLKVRQRHISDLKQDSKDVIFQ